MRFEHCYRLDLDPNFTPSLRETCWREWVSSYTYGQTQDRANYARRRLEQLGSQPDETAMMLDPPPDPAGPILSAAASAPASPEHVSAHRPPPPVQAYPVSAEQSMAAMGPENLPAETCASACRQSWTSCSPANKLPGEIASDSARIECDRTYARCMRRCFDE